MWWKSATRVSLLLLVVALCTLMFTRPDNSLDQVFENVLLMVATFFFSKSINQKK
jgi:hypothetical protein